MGTVAHRMVRAALPLALLVGLSGCSVGSGSGSRHMLYNSIEELVADSGAVVLGTIVAQGPGPDGTTVSTVEVEQTFTPEGLGTASREPTVPVPPDSDVLVRTYENPNSSATPSGLQQGPEYLLFLTPTGLPSSEPNEFFVTGAVAGIYERQGERFIRSVHDADRLPNSITADSLRSASASALVAVSVVADDASVADQDAPVRRSAASRRPDAESVSFGEAWGAAGP